VLKVRVRYGCIMTRLVADVPLWSPRTDHNPVCVGFVVDVVSLVQILLHVLQLFPVSVILPIFLILSHFIHLQLMLYYNLSN